MKNYLYIGPGREFPGFGKVGHQSIVELTDAQLAEFGGQVFEETTEPVNILPIGGVKFDPQAFQRSLEKQHRADVDEKVEEKRLATEQR